MQQTLLQHTYLLYLQWKKGSGMEIQTKLMEYLCFSMLLYKMHLYKRVCSSVRRLVGKHGILEALIGKTKMSTKLVGAPTYLGPMGYQLSRNENICKGKF